MAGSAALALVPEIGLMIRRRWRIGGKESK
jgi:hypothetical protein